MLMPRRQPRRARQTASDADTGMRNGRGRPMKRFDQLKPPRKARTLQASIIHRQLSAEYPERDESAEGAEGAEGAPPTRVSALESLPVEIIEQMFFYCLEVNLPRASVYLASALSRPAVYRALVLLAYFQAAPQSHVETRHFLPATFRLIGVDDRRRLQEDILRCKWCTFEFLQSCMPALTRLAMVREWHYEREELTWARSKGVRQKVVDELVELPDPDVFLPPIDDTSAMEKYFRPRSAMLPDKQQQDEAMSADGSDKYPLLVIDTLHHAGIEEQPPPEGDDVSLIHRPQTVLAAEIIPENIVLRKPWTDANIKLLQLLRQAMRFGGCQPTQPSPQALFEGMANAVREGNELALLVLLELHETVTGRVYQEQVPPLRLFHLVCQEPTLPDRLQCRMIALLLRNAGAATARELADDEILTRWAIHLTNSPAAAQNDLYVAKEVLRFMETQGRSDNPTGRAFGARRVGGLWTYTPCFAEEIGYLEHLPGGRTFMQQT
ncbi:uncharacterized protein Z520_08075 [Fonsecaea multimorphosa CBS 102226]|uniref:Uncharacterized protein n=1 Tax=Fonsecaea multimorphosa CBS 102226 TaxID=1442371 RepID=A0A0D2JS63_9EURO|nr:uncharacterized protein Z520_08075 [Fonsecaea multimorphosa CBS 102226]KIX96297.1 hypothetical protein Z520_08075 [Fonsecaea multimorphosa CBS 102226]OAL21958.1 hypothetical protein AYO22_07555 [Fonsecaea multimorphosa]